MSNALRSLVLAVHNALRVFAQNSTQNKSIFPSVNQITQNAFTKSLAAWPLKRGSVAAHYEPWNTQNTSLECMRLCLAFIIKCFFVFQDDSEKNDISLLKQIFEHEFFHVVFWTSIQEGKEEFFFSSNFFKPATPVILCLEDIVFQTRQMSNTDLILFENFIEHLARNGNGLVVFSKQKLISSKNNTFHIASAQSAHSAEYLKEFVQKSFVNSIEDALEPVAFIQNSLPEHAQDLFNTGAFDRLLELLAIGQDFLFSVERAFDEKIKTI